MVKMRLTEVVMLDNRGSELLRWWKLIKFFELTGVAD